MQNNQVYILVFSATFASVLILLKYYQVKKNKEQRKRYLKCETLLDFEALAKTLLKPTRFYYYDYKCGQGYTYEACRDYFNKKLRIISRALVNVNHISLRTNLFGHIYESPIIIAPSAFHCLAHIDGEVATARGAADAECIYTYNWMLSNMPEEKVLQITGPKFLHVYMTMPQETLEKIIPQAEKQGYRAIVLTCDHSTDRFQHKTISLFADASKTTDPELSKVLAIPNINFSEKKFKESFQGGTIAKTTFATGFVTWENVQMIKRLTRLPIICKGILSPMDAKLAMQYGANGIVVSNHGGRHVDTTPPAIECLEEIVDIVNGRAEVFVDTGIRTGTDILKALALGARAVLIGRPILYGLACGGHDGVRKVLDILKQELISDMACCGLTSIEQINKSIIYKHT